MANQPPKFFSVIIIMMGLITIVFFAFYLRKTAPPIIPIQNNANSQNSVASPVSLLKPTVSIADPTIGPSTAQLTIVEFADYRCTHCNTVNIELKKILAAYPTQVRLVWKDFPITSLDETAMQPFEAARCAEKQNKFWQFHDAIFSNQTDFNTEKITSIAQSLNLDMTQFQNCLDTGETKPLIAKGLEEGQSLKIDGTPYFFFNGEKYNAELTLENVAELLK